MTRIHCIEYLHKQAGYVKMLNSSSFSHSLTHSLSHTTAKRVLPKASFDLRVFMVFACAKVKCNLKVQISWTADFSIRVNTTTKVNTKTILDSNQCFRRRVCFVLQGLITHWRGGGGHSHVLCVVGGDSPTFVGVGDIQLQCIYTIWCRKLIIKTW